MLLKSKFVPNFIRSSNHNTFLISQPTSVRFHALTGIRAIAASMVFVYHNRKYWRGNLHPEILRIINEFHTGVSLFFVLSGFLIAYTYADKPTKQVKAYGNYVLLRMGRILPLYWLLLTAYYLDPLYGQHHFDWKTYSLIHGFSNVHNLDGISQAWSLSVEMSFYILAPFLCLLQKKHWMYLVGGLLVLLGVTWSVGNVWTTFFKNPDEYLYPFEFLLQASFPGRAAEFFAGMMLAAYLNQNREWARPKKTFFTTLGFFGIVCTLFVIGLFQKDIYHQGTDHPIGLTIHNLWLPLCISIAFYGLITEKSLLQRLLSNRFMIFMGNASFAFYLCHISYVNQRLQKIWIGPDRNFILLWLIAAALYFLVEKPIYGLVRKAVGLQKRSD